MGSGEEAAGALSDAQRATLTAICDTVVPSLARDRDPGGLWARKASDLGVDVGAAQLISEIPDPELRGGLLMLIDAIGGQGIARAPTQESREQILRNTALSDPRAAAGVGALINMTLFLHYGAPDPQTGQNPNWRTFGYPGPISAPPQVDKPLKIHEPQSSEETIEADACIVGLRARAARSSLPCWRRADSMSSCSRRPATTTNPTSHSSSSRPTRRCSGAAARRRRPRATSAWSPGPPSAAARRSTGPTACAHDRGSVSSGPSTAWRASTGPSSTATSMRSGTGSPRTTPAAT